MILVFLVKCPDSSDSPQTFASVEASRAAEAETANRPLNGFPSKSLAWKKTPQETKPRDISSSCISMSGRQKKFTREQRSSDGSRGDESSVRTWHAASERGNKQTTIYRRGFFLPLIGSRLHLETNTDVCPPGGLGFQQVIYANEISDSQEVAQSPQDS